ncbi:hypothetical protein FE257_008567 [Aspergillus nanangensis]|uniref:Zn(2)-C6 fungal-type domain-containing protein n=1 Tax=Aspergillus nanangensis TaxID=2582783 RepID=A0AAD4GTB2_ASPNN|nr:hypothetical protein FE257_008567 [Aspergillus nanangensis]
MGARVRRRQQLNKVTNACEPCKKKKVKCSGKNPCERCTSRQIKCVFIEADKKVIVSASYLRKLQENYARQDPTLQWREEKPGSATDDVVNAAEEETITNPLVSATSFYLKDQPSGRYRFCGPSSTWSFSQRVFLLLKNELPSFPSPDLPFHIDGNTWELEWTRTSLESISGVDGLPSLHDFNHLLSVVKFRSHQMLFLVDEEEFVPHLHEFYDQGLDKAKSRPLWFIQYLLIIALGKALIASTRSFKSPPGVVFFERAMSIMPDFVGLHRHPNLGMQVLYLAGLYLVSVDMKDAAYAYISQSLRMCIIEGLYREPPSDLFGVKFANQCRNIWWTAYILDRQLSAIVGAPVSIQDTEVTCSLPFSYDTSSAAPFLTMNAKLSRIVGNILSSVYTASAGQSRSFISTVQSILIDMAAVLKDVDDISARNNHPSLRTLSTSNSHLSLTYHQCIILATRPLFLYLLTNRLKKPTRQRSVAGDLTPTPLRPLLDTALQSAKISVKILSSLHEQASLESFFPFDLDNIFSCTFVIVIAAFIDTSLAPDVLTYISLASQMLNDLVLKGNMVSHLRKKELDLLQQMIQEILNSERQATGVPNGQHSSQPQLDLSYSSPQDTFNGVVGDDEANMSYAHILGLAEQLDNVNDSVWGTEFELDYSNIWI